MSKRYSHLSGHAKGRRPAGRPVRAGLAAVGLLGALSLAGCGSTMALFAAAPDPTVAEESQLTASLGLDTAPGTSWNVAMDGPTLDFTNDYDDASSSPYSTSATVADLYASDGTTGSHNRHIVQTDDYLGDSKNVGLAFTRAMVDDANTRYAPAN